MPDKKTPLRSYSCTKPLEVILDRSGTEWEDWERAIAVDFLANTNNLPRFLMEGSFVISKWRRITETPHDLVNEFVVSHLDDVLTGYRPGSPEGGHRCDPNFLRWVLGCFRKRAINIVDKWGRQTRMDALDETVAEPIDGTFASDLENAIYEEELIKACIKFVPEKHQEVLRLLLHGDQPHEIAERLGLSPGCVRTRLSRIRQMLGLHRETILRILETVRFGGKQ